HQHLHASIIPDSLAEPIPEPDAENTAHAAQDQRGEREQVSTPQRGEIASERRPDHHPEPHEAPSPHRSHPARRRGAAATCRYYTGAPRRERPLDTPPAGQYRVEGSRGPMRTLTLIALSLAVVGAAAAVVLLRPDRAARVATGLVSHTLCSETFVAG